MVRKIKTYGIRSIDKIPQLQELDQDIREEMKVVAHVLPFKANNYVIEELIDWKKVYKGENDPVFNLYFPRRNMLIESHFKLMEEALSSESDLDAIKRVADGIRRKLNPHPAGQKSNIPILDGHLLSGMQHKYKQTVLFFPAQGQNCQAFCNFCFRWPQFVKLDDEKFASREIGNLIKYVNSHPEVTNVLFTGGDPMVMSGKWLDFYLRPLIESINRPITIRIGTKICTAWPHRFVNDPDADQILSLFREINESDHCLSIIAHFNHYQEMQTSILKQTIKNIIATGSIIKTQSPILRYINDDANVWAEMWKQQVRMGMIPYYMFMPRDTGAQHYFRITLEQALHIFKEASKQVSGLAKTVRGPVMSCSPGKIEVSGITEINREKVFTLKMVQAKRPELAGSVFFAKYNPDAIWINDLVPAFSEPFPFEKQENRQTLPIIEVSSDLN